ncbi:MAG: O-antigen ligase family protein [Rickettsiaceae bacterium]|nr:O-antigen ligase family protein [Rickettsiaceae bacterium]MCP5377961.1 O-antigen ligase family protein [Rickettsiaceae bacterium]
MEKIFLGLIFLIPFIGLYSGLSAAVTIPVFSCSCLFYIRELLVFKIENHKLEITLILWVMVSCLWSINFVNSFFSALKFSTEFLLGILLIGNIIKLDTNREKLERILIASLLASGIIFFIESLTGGKASIAFKELIQKKETQVFLLHNLDRGMALLTLVSWVVISIFLKRGNRAAAFLLYFALLEGLSFSDNLAALVAHFIAGGVFLLTRLTILRNPKILSFLLLISSLSMIIFAFKINPLKISEKNEVLPTSAKHRLFIWNFVAKNSKEYPLLGIGFNSSKKFPVTDSQIIELFGQKLHPLPLHPHNNILQVYFELGAIGLILYLSLACKYLLIIGKNYKTTSSRNKDLICSLYACFSVYFIIAMISYNVWQSWWLFSALWIAALYSMLIIPEIDA